MNKPYYKSATVWGIFGGAALAYLYLKTLGKNKNLSFDKVIIIGCSIGAGLGILGDLYINKNNEPKNVEQLKESAKSVDNNTEQELNSFLGSINSENLSESDNKKALRILNIFLKAKKNGEWDSKGDIEMKKKVLIDNGASKDDVQFFEDILKNHLKNSISRMIKENKILNK
jgi:Na+/phosphate symporter